MRIRADVIGTNPLDLVIARATDLRPALRRWLGMRRELVRQEFEGSFWLSPGGGRVGWKSVGAFGTRPAPSSPLNRTGALLRALLGGSGGIESVEPLEAAFGVRGDAFPGATVHRGGSGEVTAAAASVPARIPVTRRMRGFLAVAYRVYLRATTDTILIPRRPFATDSPEAATRRTAIFVSHVRGVAEGRA